MSKANHAALPYVSQFIPVRTILKVPRDVRETETPRPVCASVAQEHHIQTHNTSLATPSFAALRRIPDHAPESTTTSKRPRNSCKSERTSGKASYITSHPGKASRSQRTYKPSHILSLSHLQRCHSSTYLRTRHPRNLSPLGLPNPQTRGGGGQNTAHAHAQTATDRRIDPLEPSIFNPQSSTRGENPYQSFQPAAQLR
ncbi:hypothetical protein CTAM01_05016 [Colletotrichum tamarilloi]|uniref:Uncharacterized protein n=1 Tax=Colletotrichum tamarilloi TaxID=1209934 RepID=A0ABQ9RGF2_9PEZI|nr:uncharacterized protein CTAM01_05016 [Colletotrichum tamarilloi]KAK1503027.1 hypothetical protein CTAM01_05016 [Colletotrichum tamarilloi]